MPKTPPPRNLPPAWAERWALYDTILENARKEFDAHPYLGRDPHGMFPYVLNLVEAQVVACGKQVGERPRLLIATALLSDLLADGTVPS